MGMYDMSSKFNTFYKSYVVLSGATQTELREKKELNIQRLKDGLSEYNEEHKTSYQVVENCIQGSVAMSTVVKNESNDYDIDVAIVFEKDALGDKGAQATRNIVADALRRKTKQFKAEPEIKTACVRIKYTDGYHIDFAVYRRHYDTSSQSMVYEHAGAEWTQRELTGLTDWFKSENDTSDGNLRKVIRLSKMFCNSRDSWKNMPSGLLQTILCHEKLQNTYTRIDELFYYTMKGIVNRLESSTSVNAPVDNDRDLTPRKSDTTKMTNWKNRLKSKLEDLDILFKSSCTKDNALQAWRDFFNHPFWDEQSDTSFSFSHEMVFKSVLPLIDEEQFIEDMYPVAISYHCRISCEVSGNGWRQKPLTEFLGVLQRYLPHNFTIKCHIKTTDCPQYYKVLWKVKNVGPEAVRRNQLRGQIVEKGHSITEHSKFFGNHYIECYIIKDGVCVARDRIDIPIGGV